MNSIPTEDRIWNASLALFARQGFAGTTTRDIADASGLTVGSLYHYMGSKDDLLENMMLGGMTGLLEAATAVVVATKDSPERLGSLVHLHVAVHAHHRLEAKVVDREIEQLSAATLLRVSTMRDEYEKIWRDTLITGNTRACFTVSDANLVTLALLGMCTAVATWFRPDGRLTPEALGMEFVPMALSMVRATQDGVPLVGTDIALPDITPFITIYEKRGGYGSAGARAMSRRGA